MAHEINLWLVLPLCILAFVMWVGIYLYITLTVIKHDPREIKYRKDSGKDLGILPEKLFLRFRKKEPQKKEVRRKNNEN